jgi:hypothetical protein
MLYGSLENVAVEEGLRPVMLAVIDVRVFLAVVLVPVVAPFDVLDPASLVYVGGARESLVLAVVGSASRLVVIKGSCTSGDGESDSAPPSNPSKSLPKSEDVEI